MVLEISTLSPTLLQNLRFFTLLTHHPQIIPLSSGRRVKYTHGLIMSFVA